MQSAQSRPLFVQKSLPLYEPMLAELEDRFQLRRVESWGEVLALAPYSPTSAVFLVDPYDAAGIYLAEDLRTLLAAYPSVTVVTALALCPGRADAVRTLLGWGVADVLALGVEDTPDGMRIRLLSVHARRLKRRLGAALAPYLTAVGHTLLLAAVEAAADGGGSVELARVLRSTPRTVASWCRREGVPNPRRLLAWVRLLLAAELLDEDGRTAAQVARACGYTTDGALRRALRNFLGRSATALRGEGAFTTAARAFGAELRTG